MWTLALPASAYNFAAHLCGLCNGLDNLFGTQRYGISLLKRNPKVVTLCHLSGQLSGELLPYLNQD